MVVEVHVKLASNAHYVMVAFPITLTGEKQNKLFCYIRNEVGSHNSCPLRFRRRLLNSPRRPNPEFISFISWASLDAANR